MRGQHTCGIKPRAAFTSLGLTAALHTRTTAQPDADGLPIVRELDDRVIVAAGHGRNGIVLAPWTSHRVVEILGKAAAE